MGVGVLEPGCLRSGPAPPPRLTRASVSSTLNWESSNIPCGAVWGLEASRQQQTRVSVCGERSVRGSQWFLQNPRSSFCLNIQNVPSEPSNAPTVAEDLQREDEFLMERNQAVGKDENPHGPGRRAVLGRCQPRAHPRGCDLGQWPSVTRP